MTGEPMRMGKGRTVKTPNQPFLTAGRDLNEVRLYSNDTKNSFSVNFLGTPETHKKKVRRQLEALGGFPVNVKVL